MRALLGAICLCVLGLLIAYVDFQHYEEVHPVKKDEYTTFFFPCEVRAAPPGQPRGITPVCYTLGVREIAHGLTGPRPTPAPQAPSQKAFPYCWPWLPRDVRIEGAFNCKQPAARGSHMRPRVGSPNAV